MLNILIGVGATAFTIVTNDGACEECESHAGRMYTAEEIRDNMPPFHPNCRCKVVSAGSEAMHNQYSNETQRDISAANTANTLASKLASSSEPKVATVVANFAGAVSGKVISQSDVYGPQLPEKGYRIKFSIPGLHPTQIQYFIPTSVEDAVNLLDAYYAGDKGIMSRYDPDTDAENALQYLADEGLSYTIKELKTDYIVTIASGTLAVRDKPGGREISSLSPNQKIKIVMPKETKKENDRLWIKIYYDRYKTGWVAEEFVREYKAPSEVAGKKDVSPQGVAMIADFELSEGSAKKWGIGEFDANGEMTGIYPHYIFKNIGTQERPKWVSDGGITFGHGVYVTEKMYNSDSEIKNMVDKYIPKVTFVPPYTPSNGVPYKVPNSKAMPTEVEQPLYETKLKEYVNAVNNFLIKNNIVLNQNQFDALVSFTYNYGANWWNLDKVMPNFIRDGKGIYDPDEVRRVFGMHDNYSRRLAEAELFINGY